MTNVLFNATKFVAICHSSIRKLIGSEASLLEVEGEAGRGVDGAGLRAVTKEAAPSQHDPVRLVGSPPFFF